MRDKTTYILSCSEGDRRFSSALDSYLPIRNVEANVLSKSPAKMTILENSDPSVIILLGENEVRKSPGVIDRVWQLEFILQLLLESILYSPETFCCSIRYVSEF